MFSDDGAPDGDEKESMAAALSPPSAGLSAHRPPLLVAPCRRHASRLSPKHQATMEWVVQEETHGPLRTNSNCGLFLWATIELTHPSRDALVARLGCFSLPVATSLALKAMTFQKKKRQCHPSL
jgi:hypothetical protein